MKRKHQQDFDDVIDGIIAGSGIKTVVCHVTPGGGKSTLPIQAGRLISAGLAERICWICPRMSLQDQAQRNFIDPVFRSMFGHNLLIRASTNESNPSRAVNGFVTTYQALGVDDHETVLQDFQKHRYILVLDEFHHCEADDGEWTAAIRPLYDRAAFRVLMTGTLARGDGKKIAFTNYIPWEDGFKACPIDNGENATVYYSRQDALQDRAIIPLEFRFADGVARWRKESGREVTAKLSTGRSDASQALYTALRTEYAEQLLAVGIDHWQTHRKTTNPNASLLVVSASIESAKEYTAVLTQQGLHAAIATSDDTPEAVRNIKALKAGKLKILVTVAMAYEGLDVPSVSHIVCLTNVRSMPWIEQMVARAVRIDPQAGAYETQKGYVFAPADQMFVELAARIEADQTQALAKPKPETLMKGQNGNLFGSSSPGITPLSSSMLGSNPPLLNHNFNYEKTQKEIEAELRERIEAHVRSFSRAYRCGPKQLNYDLKKYFGKPRENMTVDELEAVRDHLFTRYPVPMRREPDFVLAQRWR